MEGFKNNSFRFLYMYIKKINWANKKEQKILIFSLNIDINSFNKYFFYILKAIIVIIIIIYNLIVIKIHNI